MAREKSSDKKRHDTDFDYRELLEGLPLPEKYLIGKPSGSGQLSSSDSDDWTLDYRVSLGGLAAGSGPDPDDSDTDQEGGLLHDSDSGVHSDAPPSTRHVHWGSADTGLDLLGVSSPPAAIGRFSRLSQTSDTCHSQDSLNTSFTSSSSAASVSRPLAPLSSWMPAYDTCSRVRSLGGTPPTDRRLLGGDSAGALSTEGVLRRVRALLGDQAARARVTGIVEASQNKARLLKDSGKPTLPPSLLSDGRTTLPGASTSRPLLPKTPRSNGAQPRASYASPAPSQSGTKSRRAVRRADDINLFNPKFGVVPDGGRTSQASTGGAMSCGSRSTATTVLYGYGGNGKGVNSITFSGSRSGEGVPTAHVMPSHKGSGSVAPPCAELTRFPSEENLRRTDSAELLERGGALRSLARGTEISKGLDLHHHRDNLGQDYHVMDAASSLSVSAQSSAGYGHTTERSYEHSERSYELPERSYGTYPGRSGGVSVYNPQTYSVGGVDAQGPPPHTASHTHSHSHSGVTYADHFTSDLTSWQQKHQEALRRQQMEASQPLMNLGSAPPFRHHSGAAAASSVVLRDPHKLDAVKLAADNIIKEKDMIIERQKTKIIDLEHRTKDTELEQHKDLLRLARDDSDKLGVKLQALLDDFLPPKEFQYENATLKDRIAEYAAQQGSSQEAVERKLGAVEYELQQVKQKYARDNSSHVEEVTALNNKIVALEDQVCEWKGKSQESRQEQARLKSELKKLDGYMTELPTSEEHSQRLAEIQGLKKGNADLRQHITALDRKIADAQKGLQSRDGLIETLETGEGKLKAQISKLELDNKSLRQRLAQEGCPMDDLENVQFENKQLKSDLEKAKKLLDAKQKRQQQSEAHHRSELSSLEERLSQEESAVTALREEILAKDQNIVKMRQSMRELGSENQDLLQKSMLQQDKIAEFESQATGEIHKLESRLMKEITTCFSELQSLVQICMQHAEGQDPNISALLGVKASPYEDSEADVEAKDLASLKYKVGKVREMRNEIDRLRELISNKFAEEMGDNLNCTMQ